MFQSLDMNGDGVLTKEELILGFKRTMPEQQAYQQVEQLMQEVDVNNNGTIDYSGLQYIILQNLFLEFLMASCNKKNMASKQKLENVFKMFDKDGSGSISRNELEQMFEVAEIPYLIGEKIIKEVDENEDGEISMTEFKQMMFKMVEYIQGEMNQLTEDKN